MSFFALRSRPARWSSSWQLRRAGLFSATGVVLGRYGGALLRQTGREHVLVIGETQSRKTSAFVFPNLLSRQVSMIVHDPKEELVPDTQGWRGTFSRVVVLHPTSSLSQRYNLFDGIERDSAQTIRGVQLVSGMLLDPEGQGTSHLQGAARHFQVMAGIALDGILLYGLLTQRVSSLGSLLAFYMAQPLVELAKAMQRYPHDLVQRAAGILLQTDGRDERSGIFSTVVKSLWVYNDPLLQRATDTSDFALRDLRERARPITLYLVVPFGDQERVRPWLRTVLRQWLDYMTSRTTGWIHDVDLLIDEVPSVKRLTPLHDGTNFVAGYGVRLLFVTPSLLQLAQTYGRDHHFLEGCGVKLVYGLGDRKVAEIFSGDLGEQEVWKPKQIGARWVKERVKEPLLSATALMGLPPQQALLMARTIRGLQKVLVMKPSYQQHPLWMRRSHIHAENAARHPQGHGETGGGSGSDADESVDGQPHRPRPSHGGRGGGRQWW